MLALLCVALLVTQTFGVLPNAYQPQNSTLAAQRMNTLSVWMIRSTNSSTMARAYTDQYTTEETCHIIKTVGDYCPREHAMEYDKVVTDLEMLMGYAPVRVGSRFDPTTTTWISEDVIRIEFYTYIQVVWQPATKTYQDVGWYYYTSYIKFEPQQPKILVQYSIDDPETIPAFNLSFSVHTPEGICRDQIWPACSGQYTGVSYLNDTEFSTIAECVNYTRSLKMKNECPFEKRSRTMSCQVLHATSAILLPSVHCQHVSPHSEKCVDTCMPACESCSVNAQCVAEIEGITEFNPVYKCQCLPGYIGDGETCEPATCKNSLYAGALYGSYNCSTGKAVCHESFTHNPTDPSNMCDCPDGGSIKYVNGKPVCVAKGRCVSDRWECARPGSGQAFENINCVDVRNNWAKQKECVCNYGFNGGRLHPCVCPQGKTIRWSNIHEGNVCLDADECTANWHCGSSQFCVVDSGSTVGKCKTPTKRFDLNWIHDDVIRI